MIKPREFVEGIMKKFHLEGTFKDITLPIYTLSQKLSENEIVRSALANNKLVSKVDTALLRQEIIGIISSPTLGTIENFDDSIGTKDPTMLPSFVPEEDEKDNIILFTFLALLLFFLGYITRVIQIFMKGKRNPVKHNGQINSPELGKNRKEVEHFRQANAVLHKEIRKKDIQIEKLIERCAQLEKQSQNHKPSEERSQEVIPLAKEEKNEKGLKIYFVSPNQDGSFPVSQQAEQLNQDFHNYGLLVNSNNTNMSKMFFLNNKNPVQFAQMPDYNIFPVFKEINVRPTNLKSIKLEQGGSWHLEGDNWVMKQKATIRYE